MYTWSEQWKDAQDEWWALPDKKREKLLWKHKLMYTRVTSGVPVGEMSLGSISDSLGGRQVDWDRLHALVEDLGRGNFKRNLGLK